MRIQPGPFFAAAGVQTDKTSESLTEFFKELNGILQPIPADELARAKNYVALRFPGGFETTGDISRRLEDSVDLSPARRLLLAIRVEHQCRDGQRRAARRADLHSTR